MTPGNSSAALKVTVTRADTVVVTVSGEVDYQGCDTLRDGIAPRSTRRRPS